jgi:hypothetical protein
VRRLRGAPGCGSRPATRSGPQPCSVLLGIHGVEVPQDQSGLLVVTFDRNGETPVNEALVALTRPGLQIFSFELEGARLSDAFLAMTEAA